MPTRCFIGTRRVNNECRSSIRLKPDRTLSKTHSFNVFSRAVSCLLTCFQRVQGPRPRKFRQADPKLGAAQLLSLTLSSSTQPRQARVPPVPRPSAPWSPQSQSLSPRRGKAAVQLPAERTPAATWRVSPSLRGFPLQDLAVPAVMLLLLACLQGAWIGNASSPPPVLARYASVRVR